MNHQRQTIINTELEKFCQSIFYNSHIPDDQLAVLQTRIRNTCHNYNTIGSMYLIDTGK